MGTRCTILRSATATPISAKKITALHNVRVSRAPGFIPTTTFEPLLGPLQFSSTIRARHLRWHRWSGRVFVTCGMIIGVSALVMSFGMPAIDGVNQAAATTLFGMFFLFALGRAFWHIRRRVIAAHREWMIRAFSVGLAVATIRPIIGVFFATSHFSRLTPREFFGTAFWIGFSLHLIAAEAWIHATQPGQRAVDLKAQRLFADDGDFGCRDFEAD